MVGSKARKVLKLEEGQSPDTIIAAFQGATKKTSLEYNYASATEVSEDLMPGAFLESDEERKTGKYLFFIPSGYGGCAVHVYEDGKHTTSEAAKSFTFNSKRLEKYIKKADNLTKSKQTNKEGVVASPDVSGVEADAKRTSSKKSLSGILSGLLGKKKKKEGKSRPTSAYSVTSTESAPGPDEPDALAAEPTIYVQPKPKEEKPEVKLGMINLRQEISEALGEMLKPGVQLLDEKVIAQFNKQFKTNFAEDQFKVSTVEGFLAGEGVEDEIRRVSAARL